MIAAIAVRAKSQTDYEPAQKPKTPSINAYPEASKLALVQKTTELETYWQADDFLGTGLPALRFNKKLSA
jgi:hypothetical protein